MSPPINPVIESSDLNFQREPRRARQRNESPTVEIQMTEGSWEVSLALNISPQESANDELNSDSKYFFCMSLSLSQYLSTGAVDSCNLGPGGWAVRPSQAPSLGRALPWCAQLRTLPGSPAEEQDRRAGPPDRQGAASGTDRGL